MAHSDDDLYVNDGASFGTDYYPQETEERQEADQAQAQVQAIKAASYPIMGDIADWFEDMIKACDNLDNVVFDLTMINGIPVDRTVSIEAQVLAMKLLKERFIEKYRQFEEFRNERD